MLMTKKLLFQGHLKGPKWKTPAKQNNIFKLIQFPIWQYRTGSNILESNKGSIEEAAKSHFKQLGFF